MTTGQKLAATDTDATGILSHARDHHDEIVFTVADQTYRWTDVVLFAMRSGDWGRLEAQVREGLACEAHAAATDAGPELADLYAAADVFRRPRGLLTVEQLLDWLDHWGLTVESWLACVKRALLRRRSVARLSGLTERYPVSTQALDDVMWAEAVCSGILNRSAVELAEQAAVAADLHGTEGDGWDSEQTDEPEEPEGSAAIVDRLRAQGFHGLALDDCQYRLRRLAVLDRGILTDALIRDVTRSPFLATSAFDDEMLTEAGVCLQVASAQLATGARGATLSCSERSLVHDELMPALHEVLWHVRP